MVVNSSLDHCLGKWTFICQDCLPQDIGINGPQDLKNITCNNKYENITNNQLSFSTNDINLIAFTKYYLFLQPINAWGYGDIFKQEFTFGETKPGPVNQFLCSNMEYFGISCSWKDPIQPIGILKGFTIACDDIRVYNLSVNNHSINITENIGDNRNYTCKIKAFNDQKMYGDESRYTVYVPYAPIILLNMSTESINNQITRTSVSPSDKSTQYSINIPLSILQSKAEILVNVTLIIATSNMIIKNYSLQSNAGFNDKSFNECKCSSSWIYEIQIEYKQRITKRYTQISSKLTDVDYTIGVDQTCNQGYMCNGPLAPDKKYNLSMRAYTKNGFSTFGQITFQTEKINIYLVLKISIPCLVVVVVLCAIAIVLCKQKHKKSNPAVPETSKPNRQENQTGSSSFVNERFIRPILKFIWTILNSRKSSSNEDSRIIESSYDAENEGYNSNDYAGNTSAEPTV